jgi:small neutral amino acid transporter SnatA (MarC family)
MLFGKDMAKIISRLISMFLALFSVGMVAVDAKRFVAIATASKG